MCNACGLYYKLHNVSQNVDHYIESVKSQERLQSVEEQREKNKRERKEKESRSHLEQELNEGLLRLLY